MTEAESRWRLERRAGGAANELDINAPQTPGMNRAAAITAARAGAEKLWAGNRDPTRRRRPARTIAARSRA